VTALNAKPGTKAQQVTEALRAEIKAMQPGERLPSRDALAREHGVAHSTVQKALRELTEEGLIKGGRGVPPVVAGVIEEAPPTQAIDVLDELLDRVLAQPEVTIDYSGFTAETLALILAPKLSRLRVPGAKPPGQIRLRLLLPDTDAKLAYPSLVENPDDPAPLRRQARITATQVQTLELAMGTLALDHPDGQFTVEVRKVPLTPQVKLYILNGEEARLGLYVVELQEVPLPGLDKTHIRDILGLTAPLVPHPVENAIAWFESYWSGRTRAYTLGR
jgi:DNA-binding transcriptional regulator YhcF (GntR family)